MTVRLRGWAETSPRSATIAALAVIIATSTIARAFLNLNATGPWIFADELIYSELGRSALSGLSIRGEPVSGYGSVYPLLISPAYAAFENLVSAYRAAQAINALVASLTAIPVYLTARVLVDRRWALIAAVLAVAVPSMFYTSVIMTESAFYPVFALATYVGITALLTGSWWRQLAMLPLTALAFETRQQGVAVFGAFVLALAIFIALEISLAARGQRGQSAVAVVRRFWPSVFAVLAGAGAVVAVQAARGKPLSSLLGAYSILTEPSAGNSFRPRTIAAVSVQHLAEMDLWLGIVPAAAFLVLLGFALCRTSTREMRAFAAGATSSIVVMTVVVASFAVFTNVGRIEERNLFYVGFLPLIALVWWVAAGLPRQRRWFPLALALAVAAPASLPVASLVNVSAVSDTFGLFLPWAMQTAWTDFVMTPTWVLLVAFLGGAVMVMSPPSRAWIAVLVVACYFVLTGTLVDHRTDQASQGALRQGISGPADWIDRAVGGHADVVVLYPGDGEPLKVWENEFFNRSVGKVYTIGVPMPASLPEMGVAIDGTGVVRISSGEPIDARLVLVDASVTIKGHVVARDAPRHMVVVRTPPGPLMASRRITGVYDDGWSSAQFGFTQYDCAGGMLVVEFESDPTLRGDSVNVTPVVGGVSQVPVSVPPSGTVILRQRVEPDGGACSVQFAVDQPAVPQQVNGSGDTRSLGVRVTRWSFAP